MQLEIKMQMPKDTTTAHALEVIVTPSLGDADLAVYNVNGDSTPQIGFSQAVGTGRDFVFVESDNAPPGANLVIQIFPASTDPATFVMAIEVLEEGNGEVSDRDAKVWRFESVLSGLAREHLHACIMDSKLPFHMPMCLCAGSE